MKKIISTLLILAMVLTMALTVSADANFDKLNGTYNVNFVMEGMWVLTFTPTSLAGGTLTIVDNANPTGGVGGDYTWTYDPSTQAVTVYDGVGDPTSDVMIGWNMAGNPTFQCPALRNPQDLVATSPSGGSGGASGGEVPSALVLGDNAIPTDYMGVELGFTATEAGTYTLAAADGETNAFVMALDDYGASMVMLPYEFDLGANETANFAIMANQGEDTIDLVLTKNGAPAGGGNTGSESPENGDNAALYVAVGAVALASIFGCAIVSKKRIAE